MLNHVFGKKSHSIQRKHLFLSSLLLLRLLQDLLDDLLLLNKESAYDAVPDAVGTS